MNIKFTCLGLESTVVEPVPTVAMESGSRKLFILQSRRDRKDESNDDPPMGHVLSESWYLP